MPQENKKRGRWEEKKRKREVQETGKSPKRPRSGIALDGHGPRLGQEQDVLSRPEDVPFYGLLDDDEQEYFKRADSLLELNQFKDDEERSLFLANLYSEANSKELKIACSQSCSRLMERLILMSTPDQLKALFQKFSGHFLHLAQHRFASHCCESLFLRSAPVVTQELTASLEEQQRKADTTDVYVSMENLFLFTLNELEGNFGYLVTDPFASHTLRVLLVVLSGQALANNSTNSLVQSKKKEKITVSGLPKLSELDITSRAVPESFRKALDKMISGTIAALDTTHIRALAMHPIGNPILQLLLELELSQSGKQKSKDENSLFRKLLPKYPVEEGTSSASFVNGLLFDTVGSRLLEIVIRFAPGKAFKSLYRSLFREKIGMFAKNDTAGFVVIKILERLSKEDLEHAVEMICPHITILVKRSRISVITSLIERCQVRLVDTQPIATELKQAYGEEPSARLCKILGLVPNEIEHTAKERKMLMESHEVGKVHGSLLAQRMLNSPGALRDLITDGILATDTPALLLIAKDRTATHLLQSSLTALDQTPVFRRKVIQAFSSQVIDLALDPIASHVVDSFWTASNGLSFIRERIAEELLRNETVLRGSLPGKAVWRNWKMDGFKSRKSEWMMSGKDDSNKAAKTGIELARERFKRKINSAA